MLPAPASSARRRSPSRETVSLPNNHRTAHAPKDMLPLRICASYCAPCQPLFRAFSGWILSPPPTRTKDFSVALQKGRTVGWRGSTTQLEASRNKGVALRAQLRRSRASCVVRAAVERTRHIQHGQGQILALDCR